MPRLRNARTGAIVSCSEETASRLGSEWELADKPAPKAPVQVKKAAARPPVENE